MKACSLLALVCFGTSLGACRGVEASSSAIPPPGNDSPRKLHEATPEPILVGAPTPPAGTVAREVPLYAAPIQTGVGSEGYLTQVPLELTAAQRASGREAFTVYCATCHGSEGRGATYVSLHMRILPPPSLFDERSVALSAGRLFRTIKEGYGMMPGFHPPLDVPTIWAVVAYVQTLQRRERLALTANTDDPRQEALREAP